ncbi:hypothetical protein LTR74_018521, partial [Friedmanniomyces endolithicus]
MLPTLYYWQLGSNVPMDWRTQPPPLSARVYASINSIFNVHGVRNAIWDTIMVRNNDATTVVFRDICRPMIEIILSHNLLVKMRNIHTRGFENIIKLL